MTRLLETARLGLHRLDVVETVDDDGAEVYLVLADGVILTDSPLPSPPPWEQVALLYARWRDQEEQTRW